MTIGKNNIIRSWKNRKFTILGKPKGKGRPRFTRIGKYVRTYTPKTTTDYEELVRKTFKEQLGRTFIKHEDLETEVSIRITAYFKPNKSMSKKLSKQVIENKIGYTHKPDCDNIAKIILDALNGIAFKDDNQITELKVFKLYGEEDKVDVEIEYM